MRHRCGRGLALRKNNDNDETRTRSQENKFLSQIMIKSFVTSKVRILDIALFIAILEDMSDMIE